MTSTAPPPVVIPEPAVPTAEELCSCEKPVPQQQATHKGASRTICLTCNLPVRLSF